MSTKRTTNPYDSYSARFRLRYTPPRLLRSNWQLNEKDLLYLIKVGIFMPDPATWENLTELKAGSLAPPPRTTENVIPLSPI